MAWRKHKSAARPQEALAVSVSIQEEEKLTVREVRAMEVEAVCRSQTHAPRVAPGCLLTPTVIVLHQTARR